MSTFKIEISGKLRVFKRGGYYNGVLLWDYICRRVNSTTTVGASNYKAEIKDTIPVDCCNHIVALNIWFDDTRFRIANEEGKGCNKCLRHIFWAYITCHN